MSFIKYYECTLCHEIYPKTSEFMTCPHCKELGILDVVYDYDSIKKVMTPEYFQNNQDPTIWRYLPLLSVDLPESMNSLRVGGTPLYRSNAIEKKYETGPLYFKDDGQNPTASLKDRASVIACVKAISLGYDTVACSSTGNAASSLAGNAARLGLKSVIFVPKRAPQGKLAQLLAFGANVIKVDGDYKAAFTLSKLAIEANGWYNRNAAINPHLVEGKKTVALEIAEQLHFQPTDWVVISVGDGCSVGGVYKGFYDLLQIGMITKIPKILGVQADGCRPFVDAFETHEPLRESDENTIADSIAVGIPRNPVKGYKAITESNGSFISVSDSAILSAMKELGSLEGIFAEPAASAAYAGYKKALQMNLIHPHESATVIITGNGLKDTTNALSAFKETRLVKPTIEDLQKYMKEMNR